jgi:hypothetical protein
MIEVALKDLKFISSDDWIDEYKRKHGNSIFVHPVYLALKGDKNTLEQWCSFRKDIWLMERLDLVFDVYKSLIRYGQLEPIIINKDYGIVTGEKRSCCLLIMGKEFIKANYI